MSVGVCHTSKPHSLHNLASGKGSPQLEDLVAPGGAGDVPGESGHAAVA